MSEIVHIKIALFYTALQHDDTEMDIYIIILAFNHWCHSSSREIERFNKRKKDPLVDQILGSASEILRI